MRISELLSLWRGCLEKAGVECAALEAEILYAEAARLRRGTWHPADEADRTAAKQGEAWLLRRIKREPLQYILGVAAFRELDLNVTPDVLIPRPETELLVDHVLEALPQNGKVLDVGTGSGCIALSIAYERQDAMVTAVDYSPAALKVARGNAEKYGLQSVNFLESDLLGNVTGLFDVIAANLPYVTEEEYKTLEPELFHEPKSALTAPEEGMRLITRLAETAQEHLKCAGKIFFEVGAHQAPRLAEYLKQLGYSEIKTLLDYSGILRFVAASR